MPKVLGQKLKSETEIAQAIGPKPKHRNKIYSSYIRFSWVSGPTKTNRIRVTLKSQIRNKILPRVQAPGIPQEITYCEREKPHKRENLHRERCHIRERIYIRERNYIRERERETTHNRERKYITGSLYAPCSLESLEKATRPRTSYSSLTQLFASQPYPEPAKCASACQHGPK